MKVIAYLHFPGDCEAAIKFYKDCLNAEIIQMSRMGESQMEIAESLKTKIMHARLKIDDNLIYMSDTFAPETLIKGNNISLSLEIENLEKINQLFNKLAEGGHIKMPLQDTFWGARFGMLEDKFGINWMLNCELKK
jgi:PhnB protein